jgi:hypothetical protein
LTALDARGTLARVTARSLRRSWPFGVGLLCVAGSLQAAPPLGAPAELHGPVDPCTVANYAESDILCEFCPAAARDDGACGRRLGGLGYSKKCQTQQVAAAHGEVWCKSKRSAAAPRPPPEETQHTLRLVVLAAAAVLLGAFVYYRREAAKNRS